MAYDQYDTFEELKGRLDEIVAAVSDDTMPLDDALALYEEAVNLGLRASNLLEENIEQRRAEENTAEIDEAKAGVFASEERGGENPAIEEATPATDADAFLHDNNDQCPLGKTDGNQSS